MGTLLGRFHERMVIRVWGYAFILAIESTGCIEAIIDIIIVLL
jgi:hypothetical protein